MNQPVEPLSQQVVPAASLQQAAALSALHHEEDLLDESLMLTFPASDAISPGFIT